MAKPATIPRFATNVGVTNEPTEAKKDAGWIEGEKPPAQSMNWLFRWLYAWVLYLDSLTAEALTWTAKITCTFGTIAVPAVELTSGGIKVSSKPGTSDDPGANTLHAPNIEKAWGVIAVSGGSASIGANSAFNLNAATLTSGYVQVTFRTGFPSGVYVPVAQNGANSAYVMNAEAFSSTTCRIYIRDFAGAVQDPTSGGWVINLRVTGHQT